MATNWTDWINQENPDADPEKPYVQGGQTGGWLHGLGETVAPGRSLTPVQYAQQRAAAEQKYGAGVVNEWESRNPFDLNRMDEAMASETEGGRPNDQSPTQAWNSQPSAAGGGQRDQLMALLMQRAQQGTTIGGADPNVRAQVEPMRAQMERASRGYLDDIAEKAGPLANIQGERRLTAERTGQAAGVLESEVIGREINARRQEIAQALSLWGDQLSDQQRLELTRELSYLDDATRRYGIDTGASLQRAGLDTQRYGLDLQNDQFLRKLGLDEWDRGNEWDYRWKTLGA